MLTAFDVGFGVLVLISAVLATARGLTREILSLVTWLGSAAIAAYMYFKHPEIARGYIKEQIVADAATVAGSFIVSLIILHIITMRIADFVVDSRIGALDRTLGFVFGVLRGALIAVVIVGFGVWLATNKAPGEATAADLGKLPSWVSESKTIIPLDNFAGQLKDALPPDVETWLTGIMKRGSSGLSNSATPEDTGAAPDATAPDAAPGDTTAAPDATAPAGTDTTAPATSATPTKPGA
ncbi:MAG: CvpA family protein [Devosia sp.]|nr:CvpA family protein [Devosia sp.]